jgi:hypothetical protein
LFADRQLVDFREIESSCRRAASPVMWIVASPTHRGARRRALKCAKSLKSIDAPVLARALHRQVATNPRRPT